MERRRFSKRVYRAMVSFAGELGTLPNADMSQILMSSAIIIVKNIRGRRFWRKNKK